MNRLLKIALSVPRSIYMNFRLFPFTTAIKLPLFVANNVRFKGTKGKIIITSPVKTAMIRIGYHEIEDCDVWSKHTIIGLSADSQWVTGGGTHIGQGACIYLKGKAVLNTGDNFAISGSTTIICANEITIGNDVQFSWNSVVMDSDSHVIYDEEGRVMNENAPISIGNKVWLAYNVTILKGTRVGDNCVVGACSKLSKEYNEDNSLIVGNPAKVVRRIGKWRI